MEKELMPRIEFDEIKFTIELRGKPVGDATKYQLFCELYEDIALEKKLLGERAHKAIRELETQVVGLLERKKKKLADQIRKKVEDMWKPLREVQAETRAAQWGEGCGLSGSRASLIVTQETPKNKVHITLSRTTIKLNNTYSWLPKVAHGVSLLK